MLTFKIKYNKKLIMGIGDWGLGGGGVGWGVGDWAQTPNPHPPTPNPQSPIPRLINFLLYLILNVNISNILIILFLK